MAVHEKSVAINAPVRQVFEMWRNIESFPEFMSHVKEVEILDGGKSHWKARIAGLDEEWDAQITRMEQDTVIGWKSLSGLENSGEVRFEPTDGGTRLTVHIEYTPPAGLLGEVAEAAYLGHEFETKLQEDLNRFKSRVETG